MDLTDTGQLETRHVQLCLMIMRQPQLTSSCLARTATSAVPLLLRAA